MNDNHDNEAAGRLERAAKHWQQWQDTAALAFPVEDVLDRMSADALAVLAENKTMRQQVTAMTTEYGVEWDERGGPFGVPLSRCTDEAGARYYLAERPDRKYGGENGRLVSRLVGEWQPAERDE